jgi:tetratricopeptide (TPR) repeat protein
MNLLIQIKKIVILFILFAFNICAKGQLTYTPEELFDEGQYFFIRKDYKEALYFFKQLADKNKNHANFHFKAGECYLNIPGLEYKAVPYFLEAVKNTIPKREYDSREYDEEKAPLHAWFFLGNAYRMAGKLDDALTSYFTFMESPYFLNNYNPGVVEREIKSCERAKIIQDAPLDLIKTPFGEDINTTSSEFNPVLSKDGKTLVFVRGLKFYDAIFVSKKTDEGWSVPVNINQEIMSDGDYYPTGLNSDGTKMLFVREFEDNSDIYYSDFKDFRWTEAKRLPGKINSLMYETYATFGEDDNTIYLVSDRSKTYGGKDIFVCKLGKKGLWGKPKNLGKTINTDREEDTPKVCNNGKVLFFSSQGHYNMGGKDIFYTYFENKKWAVPRNAGYPISTTRDDNFYIVENTCSEAVYSIIDHETGLSDLYMIEIKEPLAVP